MDNRESVGVVSGAYSVGRSTLLEWINKLTQLNYSLIEQTASGVFACHVFDALYPGQIRFGKVKFNCHKSYEFVHNYKILQACFNRVKMKKQIDVERLIKGKSQDNLEFIQWIHAYFHSHACERALNYDGRARREEVMGRKPSISNAALGRPALSNLQSNPRAPAVPAAKPSPTSPESQRSGPAHPRNPVYPSQKAARSTTNVSNSQVAQLKQQVQKLSDDNQQLETLVSDAESEREFYFNKLRTVEVILQAMQPAEGQEEDPMDSMDISQLRNALEDIRIALYSEDDDAVVNEEDVANEDDVAYEEELQNDADYKGEPFLPEEVGHHAA